MEMPRNNDILTDKLLWACNSSFSQLTQNFKKACYKKKKKKGGGQEGTTLSEGERHKELQTAQNNLTQLYGELTSPWHHAIQSYVKACALQL